jgi:tRNA-specific 2-thiouridylase
LPGAFPSFKPFKTFKSFRESMNAEKKKIVVAMSGGVDSSVTAALLVEQGYDVLGVSLRMWEGDKGPRVCSDHRGAAEVAEHLGISHSLLDLREQFANTVVKPFAQDYLHGRTPNPCVSCNRDFKLGTLLRWAEDQGAEYIATGHYARLRRNPATGHVSLLRGDDAGKDQSYFLFALSQSQLSRTMFPLGGMFKNAVREKARRLMLPAAERPESQDICFGDYKALVASHATPSELGEGDVVDRSGKVLGRHGGVHTVTVGQRRGLGIAGSEPRYVIDIDDASKRVVIGLKSDLNSVGLIARAVNWIDMPNESEFAAEVQIRYRAQAVPCVIRPTADGRCEVRFENLLPAVTPGQAAVFYRGSQVLGGGWIEQALR